MNLKNFFFIPFLIVALNLVLVDRSYLNDNNICGSEENKNADYNHCEHCFVDNDSKSDAIKLFKITFFNLQGKYVSYLSAKTKLIDPKSNSPPVLIFS